MNLNKAYLFNRPTGATNELIPHAAIASTLTSRELVKSEENDASYFRHLEQHNILLNPSQVQAVRHFQGPLLTLAGAGSGKTSVLICRTGYLLAVRGVAASQILLLTYSNKAAAEMRERIAELPNISARDVAGLSARTFHAFFLQFIRRQNVQEDIFSETARQHILLKQIMREMGLQKDAYPPETLLSWLSLHKMNVGEVSDLPEGTSSEKEAKEIMLRYEKWKQENFKIDFDDVLLIAYRLLQQNPSLLQTLQHKFTYIMVDEFQDINQLQYELVKMIAYPKQNLMVVGDDDQTIYSFNGARSEFILNFEKTYQAAKVIALTINYRSTTAIVGLGNEIIRYNTERRRKTLLATKKSSIAPRYMRPLTADDEANQILQQILQQISQEERNYGDFAILYRAASNNRALLELLLLQDIPYIDYGEGQLLYEHWLIRPIVDHLRLTLNRRDFAAMESVVPTLYINREKGIDHIRRQETMQPKQGPLIHLLTLPGMETYQQEKLRERLDLIRFIHPLKPVQAIQHMRKQFYDTFIDTNERHQLTQHRETLKEMLDELETSAERFDTILQFLDFIDGVIIKSEQHKASTFQQQGNRIALMTIHKSKGLEFPVVFLIGATEGSLPHSSALADGQMKNTVGKKTSAQSSIAALEEERRLAYVAVTRAKEELFVSSPARHRGKKAEVSRFLLAAFQTAGSKAKTVLSTDSKLAKKSAVEQMETVPAWVCTNPGCPAWARISTQKEASRTGKDCPLCKAPMEKGSRVVPR